MQLHVTLSFLPAHLRAILALLTQPRRRNYVVRRRTTEGTLTVRQRAPCEITPEGSSLDMATACCRGWLSL
jgi:hypothetical protein